MYATVTDLLLRYGADEIVELLADEAGDLTIEVLKAVMNKENTSAFSDGEIAAASNAFDRMLAVLEQASREIDSYVGTRYGVPLEQSKIVATPVQRCCLALARADLADDGDNLSEGLEKDRDHWRGWLLKVSTGKATLPNLTALSTGGGNKQRRLTAKIPTGLPG